MAVQPSARSIGQGNPAAWLNKPGVASLVGTGLIVDNAVGAVCAGVASRDFSGCWRFNLGVGWKFLEQ